MRSLCSIGVFVVTIMWVSMAFSAVPQEPHQQTFLIKMAEAWRAKGLHTFPPPLVLTGKEEELMIRSIQLLAAAKGVKLTERQAAMVAGLEAGALAMGIETSEQDAATKVDAKTQSAAKVLQKEFTTKSGIAVYQAPNVVASFKTDSGAVEKALSKKIFCVYGMYTKVLLEKYNAGHMKRDKNQDVLQCVHLGDFKVFLSPTDIDLIANFVPGYGISLLCDNFSVSADGKNPQAKCRVAVAGPIDDDGHITPEYKNQQVLDEIGGEQ